MRVRTILLSMLIIFALASGCVDQSCRQMPSYPYADILMAAQPDDRTLEAALISEGWEVPRGHPENATHDLEDGWTARLLVPSPRGPGLMLVAGKGTTLTAEKPSIFLAPVAGPLATRLGGNLTYYGGSEHCGEV